MVTAAGGHKLITRQEDGNNGCAIPVLSILGLVVICGSVLLDERPGNSSCLAVGTILLGGW